MPRHSRKQKMMGCGKMKGGDGGATGHGQTTFGGIGEQHRGTDGSIAMGGASAPLPVPSPQTGGRRQKKNQKGGKTLLADLVVPAGLLYFQQRSTKKRGGKRQQKQQSRKSRGSRKQK
jgi:hypothetical protein